MNFLNTISLAILLMILQGCETTKVLEKGGTQNLDGFLLISSPIDYQHHVVGTTQKTPKLCQSTPHGSLLGSSDSLSIAAKGAASEGVSGQLGNGRGNSAFIAAEILYRTCEFMQNFSMSHEEAKTLFAESLNAVVRIGVAAEAEAARAAAVDAAAEAAPD